MNLSIQRKVSRVCIFVAFSFFLMSNTFAEELFFSSANVDVKLWLNKAVYYEGEPISIASQIKNKTSSHISKSFNATLFDSFKVFKLLNKVKEKEIPLTRINYSYHPLILEQKTSEVVYMDLHQLDVSFGLSKIKVRSSSKQFRNSLVPGDYIVEFQKVDGVQCKEREIYFEVLRYKTSDDLIGQLKDVAYSMISSDEGIEANDKWSKFLFSHYWGEIIDSQLNDKNVIVAGHIGDGYGVRKNTEKYITYASLSDIVFDPLKSLRFHHWQLAKAYALQTFKTTGENSLVEKALQYDIKLMRKVKAKNINGGSSINKFKSLIKR